MIPEESYYSSPPQNPLLCTEEHLTPHLLIACMHACNHAPTYNVRKCSLFIHVTLVFMYNNDTHQYRSRIEDHLGLRRKLFL